jgi:hypothetical protein
LRAVDLRSFQDVASREVYASIIHNGYNILWTALVLLGLPSREALANAETEEGEEGEEEEEEAAADSVASSPSMVVGDFRPPKRKLALQLPEDEDRVTGSALSAQSRESQHCARLGFGICSFLGLPCTASYE